MGYSFYTSNENLSDSLHRYFSYIDSNIDSYIEKCDYLFWDFMLNIDDKVLKLVEKYKGYRVVPIIYRKNKIKGCLNFKYFEKLNKNLPKVLLDAGESSLLNLERIQITLDRFFKSHGKDAMFKILNKVRQGFKYGLDPIFLKEYNHKDLDDKFLKPGLNNWQSFLKQFQKYQDFLYICGFRKEVKKINNLIHDLEPKINYIDHHGVAKSLEDKDNIDGWLEEIDQLLMAMKKKREDYK